MFAELRLRSGSDLSTVTVIQNVSSLTFSAQRNAVGTISFGVPYDYAASIGLDVNSVIEVLPNGVSAPNMWFGIQGSQGSRTVDGAQIVTLSGQSLASWLTDCIVYPSTWPEVPTQNPDGTTSTVIQGHSFQNATPGNIIRTLVARGVERGGLAWLDVSQFTGTTTSSGAAWSSTLTNTYANGTNLLQVVQDLSGRNLIDFEMDNNSLKVYNQGETPTHYSADQITFKRGQDITQQTRTLDATSAVTSVLIIGDQASIKEVSSADSLTAIGRRREMYVSQGGITDLPTLQLLGNAQLSISGHISTEDTLGVTDQEILPWVNYQIGDWVWEDVDGTLKNVQIQQITASQQDANYLQIGLTLGDVIKDADEKQQQLINNITGQGAGAYGALPNQSDFKPPSAPSEVVATPSPYRDNNGIDSCQVTITWAAPTTNTDGTPLNDLDRYEIQYKAGNPTDWSSTGNVPASTAPLAVYLSNIPCGLAFTCQVRAVDTQGNASPWATQTNSITALPKIVTTPPTPSTPTAEAGIQSAIFKWDGLDNTGSSYDASWAYTELYVSTLSGFTPSNETRYGTFNTPSSSVVASGLTYGDTYYACLIAVDKSGNRSNTSAQSAGVAPLQVNNGDIAPNSITDEMIADAVITGAKIADGTITDENIKPNSVTTNSLSVTNFGQSVYPNGGFEDATTQPTIDTAGPAGWQFVSKYPLATVDSTCTYLQNQAAGSGTTAGGTASLKVSTPATTGTDKYGWAVGSTRPVPTALADVWYVTFKVFGNLAVPGGLSVIASLGTTPAESQSLAHTSNGTNVAAALVDPDGSMVAGTTALDLPSASAGFHTYEVGFTVPAASVSYKWVTLFIAQTPQTQTTANYLFLDSISMRPVGGSATITKLTAAKITTGVLQAASSILVGGDGSPGNYARIVLGANALTAYDASNNVTFKADATDGSVVMSGTLQVPSNELFAANTYAGQTTINEQGIVQTLRPTNNIAISAGPDLVGGYNSQAYILYPVSDVTGGTWKIGFCGVFSAPLAYNATAATVQTALNGLSSVASLGTNAFSVVDGDSSVWTSRGSTGATSGLGPTGKGYYVIPGTPLATRYLFPVLTDGSGLTGWDSSGYDDWISNGALNTTSSLLPVHGVNAYSLNTGLDAVTTDSSTTKVKDSIRAGTSVNNKAGYGGTAGAYNSVGGVSTQSRLFNYKVAQFYNNTAVGYVNFPLAYFAAGSLAETDRYTSFYQATRWLRSSTTAPQPQTADGSYGWLRPNTTYVLSWHMTWEQTVPYPSGGGSVNCYLDCSKVKINLRNYAKTSNSTLHTGISGVITNISRDTITPFPPEISRAASWNGSTFTPVDSYVGLFDAVTGMSGSADINGVQIQPTTGQYPYDYWWRRFYIVFTTPASMNDGDMIELQLPTAVESNKTASALGGFTINGVQLETAGEDNLSEIAPTRYFDYLEPGIGQLINGPSVRYATSDVTIPTYAETVLYSKTVASKMETNSLQVGNSAPGPTPNSVLTVTSHAQINASLAAGSVRGPWQGTGIDYPNNPPNTAPQYTRPRKFPVTYPQGVPYDGGWQYSPFRYKKDSRGLVLVDALLNCSQVTAGTVLAQVDDASCPDYVRQFMCISYGGNSLAFVNVYPSGEIYLGNFWGSNGAFFSLSNIRWLSDYSVSSSQWTYVGDTGAPAYTNSWVPYDSSGTWPGARYYKDPQGLFHLGGLVKGGTNSAVFTLPCYVDAETIWIQPASGGIARVDIQPGAPNSQSYVSVLGYGSAGGTNGYVSLDGIIIKPASSINWKSLPTSPNGYGNSWVPYGSGNYVGARFGIDSAGVAHGSGLIKTGAIGNIQGTNYALPSIYRPSYTTFIPNWSASGTGMIKVQSDGNVRVDGYGTGGTSSFVSLDNCIWFPDLS